MIFRRNPRNSQGKEPMTLEAYARTVEDILAKLSVDPVAARLPVMEGSYGWTFSRGSATIQVYISEQDGRGYFQVLSPIIHLPSTGLLQLYRYLLELNLKLTNASLGVYEDVVFVFNERIIDGLDEVEANNIITLVAGYADDLDNDLVTEFGGRMHNQTG